MIGFFNVSFKNCNLKKNCLLEGLGHINLDNGDQYDGIIKEGKFNEQGL